MYDIIIVGLGPAGAVLAKQLASRYKVLALDKKEPDNKKAFSKCCGGLLSDDAQKTLVRLGLVLPKDVLVDPQVFSVRTIDPDVKQERYYQRSYLNMDRFKFDQWLISLIPETVECYQNSKCTQLSRGADGIFNVNFKTGQEEKHVRAKIVIGADGANSFVRRELGKPLKAEKYVAIQKWYKTSQRKNCYLSFFDQSITDSYGWALSKDEYFIAGIAVPRQQASQRFEQFEEKLRARGIEFGEVCHHEGCQVLLTNQFGCQDIGCNGVFYVGEAGGFISSSSLEGISYAMDGALALSKVLNESLKHIESRYHKKSAYLRRKLDRRVLKRIPIYNPTLRRWILNSGIDSIKIEV